MDSGQRRLLLVGGVFLAVSAWAFGSGVNFSLERLEGTHENLPATAQPVNAGTMNILITSPENSITLEDVNLAVEPADQGWHRLEADVTFSGSGRMITEVSIGSIPAKFEDEVVFPRQAKKVVAWATIRRQEEDYLLRLEETPDPVEIEIESRLAENVVSFCRKLSMFVAGGGGCDDLDYRLAHPRIPLPDAGSEFVLRRSDLTEDEQARLDVYLSSFQ